MESNQIRQGFFNNNKLQQFPIQAGNAPQPLNTTSLPFSTVLSTPTVDINPAHPT